jgi:hypothetical protein
MQAALKHDNGSEEISMQAINHDMLISKKLAPITIRDLRC